MNAYSTRGQARIQPGDVSDLLLTNQLAGACLAGLERQRGFQAHAEAARLLKQNAVTQQVSTSRVSTLRQTIGVALIRAGERLASAPGRGVSMETTPVAGTVGTTA